jgi:hypothetical protein
MRIKSETIKAKTYPLMADAVEVGLRLGWNRAHKHTDAPTPDAIQEAQADAVMIEIAERFTFSDDYE